MADKNPFDQFDPPKAQANPFDQFDGQPESSGAFRRFVTDPAISAAKGVIGLGEGIVGAGDIATLGKSGKGWSLMGYDPKTAKGVLDEYLTPEQRMANREVEQAKGFLPTVEAAVKNPSTIAHGVVESLPSMIGGAGVARGARAVNPGLSALKAGAIGEGVIAGGMSAEGIRQQTQDGELTAAQAALAAGSGLATGLITGAGGAVARKLGIGDIETALAGGAAQKSTKGLPRRVGEGFITEGLLEEMPQSAQEQIAQNLALGKPWDEGVQESAAMGALTGGVLGGGFNVFTGGGKPEAPPPAPQPPPLGLPAPGQTTIPMGAGGPQGPNVEVEAAQMYANSIYAARAAHDAEAEALKAAGKQDEIKGLLPAPDSPLGRIDLPGDAGLTPFTQDQARQNAVDNAAALYARRDAEEARLQKLAAQGPISGVAAAAIRSGLAQDTAAARQGEVDDALAPKEGALSMPGPATEPDQVKQKRLESALKMAPFAPLNVAQAARARDPDNWAVVPHPSGQGFALAPVSYLNEQQLKAVAGIQQPGGALPTPSLVVGQDGVAATPAQAQTARQEEDAFRRTSVPKQMPFDTVEAAKAAADRRTATTGIEHTVVPHPTKRGSFTFQSVQDSQPFTQREQNQVPEQAAQSAPDSQQNSQPFTPVSEVAAQINQVVAEAATSPANERQHPTAAQAAAGNYKKARIPPKLVHGLEVTVENPDGSVRVDKNGEWASGTVGHYGYIRRTKGADGDKVDVNIGPKPESKKAFVVNQNDPKTGKFDEHKVMLGYETAAEAEAAYRANYPADWQGFGSIHETDVDGLKSWLKSGDATTEFAGPKVSFAKEDLDGIVVRQPVQVEETGETVYIERDAKEALVDARTRVRKLEAVLKCLKS